MPVGSESRQLLVGALVRRQASGASVEGLVIEQLRAEPPGVVAACQAQVARQEYRAAGLRALAEILEIMRVADILRVDLRTPLLAEVLDGLEPLPAAILVGEVVVRQVVGDRKSVV